jgi:hypothetical protein
MLGSLGVAQMPDNLLTTQLENKTMKRILASAFLIFVTVTSNADTATDNLKARFIGRTGTASEDRRVDEFAASSILGPGPKTGCHGDTFSAGVTVTSIEASIQENVAIFKATYNGKYTRQGWVTPCVQSPPPNGHEDRNVSGVLTFTLKQIPFKNVEISWGDISGLGEVNDAGHDSNIFAKQAAQNAILSGL